MWHPSIPQIVIFSSENACIMEKSKHCSCSPLLLQKPPLHIVPIQIPFTWQEKVVEIRDRHTASLLFICLFLLNCTGCIRPIIFHTDSFESYLYFCAHSCSYHLSSHLTSINYDIPYRKWKLPSTIYFSGNS